MRLQLVSCPQCGKSIKWSSSNPFRPFCSERCKTIDLAQWAQETYRIPEPEYPAEEREYQNTDND